MGRHARAADRPQVPGVRRLAWAAQTCCRWWSSGTRDGWTTRARPLGQRPSNRADADDPLDETAA